MNIPQTKPYIPQEDAEIVLGWYKEILESGRLINGRFTEAFEKETADSVGVKNAVAMNSCTSALQTILEFIDVRDKKVLVPVNTFIASSNAIVFAGGIPEIIDICDNLLMDFKILEKKIPESKALLMVHLAGYIHPQIDEIKKLCDEHKTILIEDAAHAHGAFYKNTSAGAFGFGGAFSYYASKIIATGAGGMLTTNNDDLAYRARSVRFHGEDEVRGIQNRIGNDWIMTELQAALGLAQLRRLPEIIEKRMSIARRYDEAFGNTSGVKIFPLQTGAVSGYYKYPLRILPPIAKNDLKTSLEKKGLKIGSSYWPPIHLQPVYREKFGFKEGDFPVAEKLLQETISLPLFPSMTGDEIKYVIDSVLRSLQEFPYRPQENLRYSVKHQ
jgi:perosamine synthetase